MGLIKDILRQYWANILAGTVFACAAWRFWRLGKWLEQDRLDPFLLALAGFVAILAGSEWTGWTSEGWGENVTSDRNWLRQRPHTFRSPGFRILGAVMLVWGTIQLYGL